MGVIDYNEDTTLGIKMENNGEESFILTDMVYYIKRNNEIRFRIIANDRIKKNFSLYILLPNGEKINIRERKKINLSLLNSKEVNQLRLKGYDEDIHITDILLI